MTKCRVSRHVIAVIFSHKKYIHLSVKEHDAFASFCNYVVLFFIVCQASGLEYLQDYFLLEHLDIDPQM